MHWPIEGQAATAGEKEELEFTPQHSYGNSFLKGLRFQLQILLKGLRFKLQILIEKRILDFHVLLIL